MRKYRNYTDEQVIEYAKEVKSIAGLLRKMGLKVLGSNYYTARKLIDRLKIDTSHWTGQLWSKGRQIKDWQDYSRPHSFKKHLVTERGNQCQCCLNTEWLQKPIKLELHHVDGNRTNNDPVNLQLLCPNCHSFTGTWRKPIFPQKLITYFHPPTS